MAEEKKRIRRSAEERAKEIDDKIESIKKSIEQSKAKIKELEKKKEEILNPKPRARKLKLNAYEQVLVSRGADEKTARAMFKLCKGMDDAQIRAFLNIDN